MTITGTTRVFYVLGDPVAQVRAPEVFNALFAAAAEDAVLVPAQVRPADLQDFVQVAFNTRNVGGLWLTIPHKSAALSLVGHCDAAARAAGAINAVRRCADGRLEGALFDGVGFVKALNTFGLAWNTARVLLVGAGGAGKAIAASLAQHGVRSLAIYDQHAGSTRVTAAALQASFGLKVQTPASGDPSGYDLVVNCTPLGLNSADPLPFDVARLDAASTVVDILMTREPTPLLQACAARGIKAFPGFEMMLQQVPEYLHFFGLDAVNRVFQANQTLLHSVVQRGHDPAALSGESRHSSLHPAT